jgi:Flp pilus assembly secretin CpaC
LRWGLGRVAIFGSFPDQESQSTTLTAVNGTTTSGLPIEVAFGQVLPFFTAEIYYDYFGRRRVEYIPNAVFVGTYLWCLPVVVGTGAVKMTLRPSFSYYAGAVTSPRGEVLPIVTYQDVATTVTVPDGESLVIGGLRQVRDEANRRFSGLLRDVRVYESSSPTMIVTPRILRPIAPE